MGETVMLDGDRAYVDYMRERWSDGLDFVNVEHDVLPTPSHLDELYECPRPWCSFPYGDGGGTTLGCVRFRAAHLAATTACWEEFERQLAGTSRLWFHGWAVDGRAPWALVDSWHQLWCGHFGGLSPGLPVLHVHLHDRNVEHRHVYGPSDIYGAWSRPPAPPAPPRVQARA
jgi:hypothetical protein